MQVEAIKTRVLLPPQDDLFEAILASVKQVSDGDIIAVTSKAVSIHEGRCQKIKIPGDKQEKDQLIKQEADRYIDRNAVPNGYAILTMKHKILIPSAGVDESNANGYFILWPEDPSAFARRLYEFLCEKYQVENIGVIITDSHTTPLRLGVMGISLGHYGFRALKNYVGCKDLFGREFKMERTNVVDALATAAVLVMGEGTEQTPLAQISDVPFVEFVPEGIAPEIDPEYDLYSPLINSDKWETSKH